MGCVFVCSNSMCLAVWTANPNGHCPACKKPNGGGWSTVQRVPQALPLPDHPERVTLSGRPPVEPLSAPAPDMAPARPGSNMHKDYWVLSEAERGKGFVRPVRSTYVHIGVRPKYALRDLTEQERADYADEGFVKYEEYPESEAPLCGKFWTAKDLASGCGTSTTMGRALSETYARNPKFYGATFCCACNDHLRVEEFVWQGTDERVGS